MSKSPCSSTDAMKIRNGIAANHGEPVPLEVQKMIMAPQSAAALLLLLDNVLHAHCTQCGETGNPTGFVKGAKILRCDILCVVLHSLLS